MRPPQLQLGFLNRDGGIVRLIPFYYGYAMVPVAMIALASTSPGQTFLISQFNTSLRESLNLSHSGLTGAYMLGSFLACLPMSLVGWLQDRFGIRRTMLGVVIGFGAACIGTSQATGIVSLCLAFFFLRSLGQGSLTMLAGNTLAMWFRARLGTFTGLQSMAMAVSVAVMPPAVLGLIGRVGWEKAFITLGVIVWCVMIPIIIFVFRNRPEDVGQTIDGAHVDDDAPGAAGIDFTLRQATRTPAYWIILATTGAWGMIGTAVFFNIQPILGAAGLNEATAAAMFTTFAICLATMQMIGGVLSDRLPLNRLLALGVGLFMLSVVTLMFIDTAVQVHIFAALAGMGQGLIGMSTNTAWARYFGRAHLGKIRGSLWTVVVAASSVGPFIMGFLFDRVESYTPSLLIFVGVLLPLTIAAFWATHPKLPERA